MDCLRIVQASTQHAIYLVLTLCLHCPSQLVDAVPFCVCNRFGEERSRGQVLSRIALEPFYRVFHGPLAS